MSKLWRAICPIRQYDDKLILQCNSYRKGHTHLVWYNTSDPDNKNESEILSSVVTVTGLDEGEYAFYTRSDDDAVSIKTYIQILKETASDVVTMIEQYVDNINQYHKDALGLLRARLDVEPGLRPIDILIALYGALSAQNANEQRAYFQLIVISQYCDNNRNVHMNKDNEAPVYVKNAPKASIEAGSMVTKVVIHKLIAGKNVYYTAIDINFKANHDLQLLDDSEYIIEAYVNSDLVGVYVHFSGNDMTKKWLWEDQCTATNRMTDAKEQLIELPAAFSSFAEEDQQRLLIEKAKNPYDELVARPQAVISKGKVDIFIGNPELLSLLGDFYVVAKEPDQLFVNGFDRAEKITGPSVTFNKARQLLSDSEDYYFYIQDSNKRLVSKLELVSLSGVDYDDYKESCKQLEFYNYTKRLMPLITYRVPDASEVVKLLLDVAKDDIDVNISNVYKYLIGQLTLNKHLGYFNGAVNAIMEDHVSHSQFSQSFFSNGIKLNKAIDMLIFPPKNDTYIIHVDKININRHEVVTEYYESGIGAIEIQARGADYFIFQAIDKQSYRRSGYVFVNTAKYNPCVTGWNIDIEVI